MFSQTVLIGRLGDDPKVNYTKNDKAVANFSMATSKKYKDKDGDWQEKTNWHRVTVWGGAAEAIGEYLHKGSLVGVIGESQTREYEKDDEKKYITEVIVSGFDGTRVIFLDSKGSSGGDDDDRSSKSSRSSSKSKGSGRREERSSGKREREQKDSGRKQDPTTITDDDIPF